MREENIAARSKRYSALKARFFTADVILTVIALGAFQFFLSRPVSRFASGVTPNFYAACFIFSAAFLLFLYLVGSPLHLAASFFVERVFGLSKQNFAAWLADEAKSFALSFALSIACIQVFYFLVRNFPSFWWLIAAAAWVLFSILLAHLLPVVLIPIFYRYRPIKDPNLKEKVMEAAEKAGVPLLDVCQIDFSRKTVKANAALVGLGRTRRVVLADNLTKDFSAEEVVAVVAHEFGHFKRRHVRKLLTFSAALTVAGLFALFLISGRIADLAGARGISDISLLPALVFLMAVSGLFILPGQNLFSRALEREADRFALGLTRDPDSFIAMMRKLAERNLAEMEPSRLKKIFLYNHPPIAERIRMAEEFAV